MSSQDILRFLSHASDLSDCRKVTSVDVKYLSFGNKKNNYCISVLTADFASPTSSETDTQINNTAATTPITNSTAADISRQSYSKHDKGIRKPSAGLPPHIRHDEEMSSRHGDLVHVYASLRKLPRGFIRRSMSQREWTLGNQTKSSIHTLRRVAMEHELKNITPVKDLLRFRQEANATPPQSAKSGSKIYVDKNPCEKVKADIEEAMEMKSKK